MLPSQLRLRHVLLLGTAAVASASRSGLPLRPAHTPKAAMTMRAEAGVPALGADSVAFLKESGVDIAPLDVLGAEVSGLDLRNTSRNSPLLPVLQKEMAARGYLVFRGQGVLSGDEQVQASELFGGRKIHSTHGVHPKAPNKHIFRLSNDQVHPDRAVALALSEFKGWLESRPSQMVSSMITRLPKVYGSSCPRLDWIRSDTCAAKVRVWKHVEPF